MAIILGLLTGNGTTRGIPAASALDQAPKKNLMVALGDSITAGFFADTHIQSLEPDFTLNFPPFTNKKSDSWASGKSIYSHYYLLRKALLESGDSTPLDMLNAAVPGDKAQDVIAQAKKVEKAMRSGKYELLKYVVLLIGANDACAKDAPYGTVEYKMRQSLKETFDILAEIHQGEPIRVLVAGIPKVPDLARAEVAHTKTLFGLSCHFFRDDFLRSCTPLLNWKTNEEYEKRVAIVEHTNEILQDAVVEANNSHSNLQVVFTNELFNTSIQPDFLAMDCFHPSREGQETISSTLWAQQPWYSVHLNLNQ